MNQEFEEYCFGSKTFHLDTAFHHYEDAFLQFEQVNHLKGMSICKFRAHKCA